MASKKNGKRVSFSIPYNGDLELVRWAILTGKVSEVYFSGPAGADFSSPYQNEREYSDSEIRQLVSLCAEHGVARNFLMNRSVMFFDSLKEIRAYLKALDKVGGVTDVTLGDRMAVPYFREMFPLVRIQASVFMHVDSARKVKEALKMGVTGFCLDVSMNRNGDELERIKRLRPKYPQLVIKLLANHGCYDTCFFAKHEDWPILCSIRDRFCGKDERMKDKYLLGNRVPSRKCIFRTKDLIDEIKRPFIRPEDVRYYETKGWADVIKIAYRLDSTPVLKKKLKAYFGGSYKGDVFELAPSNRGGVPVIARNGLFPAGFARKVSSCGNECDGCSYCADVATRVFAKRARAARETQGQWGCLDPAA